MWGRRSANQPRAALGKQDGDGEFDDAPAFDSATPFSVALWAQPAGKEGVALLSKMDDAAAYRVIAVDLRGFGDSEAGTPAMTPQAYAQPTTMDQFAADVPEEVAGLARLPERGDHARDVGVLPEATAVPEQHRVGGRNRLHDRLRYRRDGDAWVIERLAP